MNDTPATFERDRISLAGNFAIYADRKAKPFVRISSGLSHQGGSVQHILSCEEAIELSDALRRAAVFASTPLLGDRP